MKKIAFLFSVLLMHFFCIAGEHVFNVVALSGSAKLSNGTVLKSGDKVMSDQTIVMADNSYLALMHKTGKTVEVQKAGDHKVTDLASAINQGGSNFTSQYSEFVMKQMVESNSDNNYNVTGSVNRDIMKNIEVFLPKQVDVLKNIPLHFSWASPKKGETYTVKVLNVFDKVIYEQQVTENEITLDLSAVNKLQAGAKTPYLLQVSSNAKKGGLVSKKIKLMVKTSQDEKNIINEYNNLKSELGASSAINSLILASFYEAKGLTGYAIENFEEAKSQAPKVDHYERLYVSYLRKRKINTTYLALRDEQ
ncbi:MAG: hypothetical protein GY827_05850 [Cytophagales bacterium]|nr:hypothetical protein [Cytophagales bacterium]